MSLSDQEKIKIAKIAFAKFVETINGIIKKQKTLFENVLEKMEERKIKEHREKMEEVFKRNKF